MAGVSPAMVVVVMVICGATLLQAAHALPSRPRPLYTQSVDDRPLYVFTLGGKAGEWDAPVEERSIREPQTPVRELREVRKRALTLVAMLQPRPHLPHPQPMPHPEDSKRPYGTLRWGR